MRITQMNNEQRENILKEYIQGKTVTQLSQEYNLQINSLRTYLESKYDSKSIVSMTENYHKNVQILDLDAEVIYIIIGMLCGRASLKKKNPTSNPYFTISDKCLEYIEYVKEMLELYDINCSFVWNNNGWFTFQTATIPELNNIFESMYFNNVYKKLNNVTLNPTVLLHWYVTSGNLNEVTQNVTLSTNFKSSTIEDQLKDIFGAECSYIEATRKYKIPGDYAHTFFTYIGNSPVTCYDYKFLY